MRGVCFFIALWGCGGGAAQPVVPADPAPEPIGDQPPPGDIEPPAAADGAIDAGARAERIELTFMGDVMFGGTFSGRFVPQDAETHDPVVAVAELVQSDLALANLETTVVSEIPVARMKGNLRFAATPAQVATLPRSGIRYVTLANNHANDLDGAGIAQTPDHLRDLGIAFIGAARSEQPVFRAETIEVKGWRIAFVAATTKLNRKQQSGAPVVPVVEMADLQQALVPVIEEAHRNHDLVLVVLHWGTQYAEQPAAEQVEAAHAFIDAGASAVIGHHPHVLQGIERYRHGLIAYSLGNFIFQNAVKGQRDTGVLRLGFFRNGPCIDKAVFHPAVMQARPVHHPVPAKGAAFAGIASKVARLSAALSTEWRADGQQLVTAAACPP